MLLPVLVASGLSAAEALRIEILRGDGCNNNPIAGTATTPVVRVWDAAGRPVAGALVVFSPPRAGASVTFAGFPVDATALTDESGMAAASRLSPARADGPLEIAVLATHAGHSATAVVRQINLGVARRVDDNELTVIQRPAVREPGRKPSRGATIAVRIEDSAGRPVSSATVLFVLRKTAPGHRPEELASATVSASASGEAGATLARPRRGAGLEFMVRAEINGRRATRFFPVTR